MLPDYPIVKEMLWKVFSERIGTAEARSLGFLGGCQQTLIKEGRGSTLDRADGSTQESNIEHLKIEQSLNVDYPNLENLHISEVFRFLDNLGARLAQEKTRHTFEVLSQELEKIGNVESSKNPAHEKILLAFEKMDIHFVDGRWIPPSLVANPATAPILAEGWNHIRSSPALLRRLSAIIDQKREQYRDREAARKLVE